MRLRNTAPRWAAPLAQVALAVCLAAVRPAAAAGPKGLPVPGGTASLLAAAGLEPSRPRTTAILDIIRVLYESPEGFDAAADERRARVLRHLETANPSLPFDEVPLPIPEAAWRAVLEGQPPGTVTARPLLNAILADRNASLLYYGLFSMDDDTRAYLAATPSVLRQIYTSHRAAILAVYGRNLRVRRSQVETPGGPSAAPLWEAVAKVPASRPDAFILEVLGKDEGRLALLYDALAHLDGAQQSFVLRSTLTGERRIAAFEALYASCLRALRCWHPASWPFLRVVYDPAELLMLTPVEAGGGPEVLTSRRLWEQAFSGRDLPGDPSGELANANERPPLDAAWLVDTVVVPDNAVRRMRAETWLFGQRVFHDAPPNAMPEVLVALRGFGRYRALAATLERLGIRDPAVYAAALRQAQRVSAVRCRDRAATALALYQGALVLIERARLARVLDLPAAARLVSSLARVPMSDRGEYLGAVASWIESDYLPAIAITASSADPGDETMPVESRILGALAGLGAGGSAARQEIEYEGTRYRVDPAAVELGRLRAVRARQGGSTIDSALHLARDAATAPHGSAALRRRADEELAGVLRSLAYACSLGDPDGPALFAGDPSARHDFGLAQVDREVRTRGAWAIPTEGRGDRGWRVIGALLALDVALGAQSFRPITMEAPPAIPTVTQNDRRAFAEAVVLANPAEYTDRDMELIGRALRRGRAQVTALVRAPAMLARVADAAMLDESRRQAVAWALVHEPDEVISFFSAGDLLRLGADPGQPIERLDAWGTSGLSFDGRLCLHFPLSRPWTTLSGRRGKALSATLVPDLALLVAEALNEQRLPAVLTRAVLAAATPHVLDRLALAFEDDWMTMVGDIERIARSRMDDYLAAVVTSGPLVPVARGDDRAPDR